MKYISLVVLLCSMQLPASAFVVRTQSRMLSKRCLSDVPQDESKNFFRLPPPPQDAFVMIGDLLSLAVYGFSDHFFCQDLAPYQPIDTTASSFPVWLDATHAFAEHVQFVVHSPASSYSPLLEPTGLAACLLAFCWLIAGYFHSAFLYKNTIQCPTPQALAVTAQTWLTTCCMLFAILYASNHAFQAPFLTKGDADYILGSLTVLGFWRFLASQLVGW